MAPLSLDASFNKAMGSHLNEFFRSLQVNTTSAFNSFLGTLSTFSTTLRIHQENLQDDTLLAARNFASVIDTVAISVLELEETTEAIGQGALGDLSRILDEKLTIVDNRPTKSLIGKLKCIRFNSVLTFLPGAVSHPAYIEPSYKWLLLNLHNPYPSKETKKNISRQTHCSVKDIDAWFVDVRKRIGWNKLRKTKFSNKQEKIIAASTHFFKPRPSAFTDDLNATLQSEMDPYDAYRRDFAAIATVANSLYADRFPELMSTSVNRLVKHAASVEALNSKLEQTDSHLGTRSSQPMDLEATLSYPTPEPSPPGYHLDDLSPSSPISVSQIPPMVSRKRRNSSSDASDADAENFGGRSSKRIRSDQAIDDFPFVSLPSPSPDVDLSDDTQDHSPSTQLTMEGLDMPNLKRKRCLSDGQRRGPSKRSHVDSTSEVVADTTVVPETALLKRKRRLSDGESQCLPKRPHNALAQPRLQTVSDPFPMANPSPQDLLETWFQDAAYSEYDLSEIPTPANLDSSLSLTAPLDVCNGQYDISADYLKLYPAESLTCLIPGEPSIFTSSVGTSNSCSALPYDLNTVPNSMSAIAASVVTLPNYLGSDSTPAHDVSLSSQYTPFSDSEQLLSAPDWSEYLQSCFPISVEKANLSHTVPHAFPDLNSSDAKRAKIQALNDQIRQLEAEL